MEITAKQLQEKINKGEKIIVEFYGHWCNPCMIMKPKFEKIASENTTEVEMFTMDVDKIIELSQVVLKEKKYTRIAKNKNKKTITPNLFQTSTQKKQETQSEILTEQICIDFLKKRNYKISKQVIQYEEI